MKTILVFDDDEREEARAATRVTAYWAALSGLDERLRNSIKYDEALSEETRSAFVTVRDLLRDELDAAGVSLEDFS